MVVILNAYYTTVSEPITGMLYSDNSGTTWHWAPNAGSLSNISTGYSWWYENNIIYVNSIYGGVGYEIMLNPVFGNSVPGSQSISFCGTVSVTNWTELDYCNSFELRERFGAGWKRQNGGTRHYYRDGQKVGIWPVHVFDGIAQLKIDCVVKPDDTIGVYPTLIDDTDSPDWVTEPMALVWYCVREFCLTQMIGVEGAQQKAAFADAEYKKLVKQMNGKT